MNLGLLSFRNVGRNPLRTILTILGVGFAVVAFVFLRTITWAWTVASEVALKDRLVTRHKVTFIMTLPKRYIDEVRGLAGVRTATWGNWFGGKDPANEREFFATIAVDPPTFFPVYDEIEVEPGQKQSWLENRRGLLVGDVLARKLGWKVGQKVTLRSQMHAGDFEFEVSGIYTATRKTVDRSTVWFHWEYMNERVREREKDQIGWIIARIDDPDRAAEFTRKVDALFEERDVPTLTQDERSFNTSFLGMFSAILSALDIVSLVILGIMGLILGNTIAMGSRERVVEYGTMRAIGFLPRHIGAYVLGEGALIGLAGGLAGIGLAYPIVQLLFGRFLEENMGGFFPYFRISPDVAVSAVGLPLLLGVAAALQPAGRAMRVRVVDALRRVG